MKGKGVLMGDIALNSAKIGTGFVTTLISFLWGEWSVFLTALFVFVTFDWLTGLAAAWRNEELSAREGFWGVTKKMFIFGVITLAYHADNVYAELADGPLEIGEFHLSAVGAAILWYLANEAISITENLGRIGMRLPTFAIKAIKAFESKDESKKDKDGVA
ncbi:phage holin family protein [Paenalkalicoccus suaedae]|uniref:Phage holin family protein n=1 Tax=Paenalkalicoccus suaedae TaxID=2592382 RepID=A0A859FGV4_9BACI|nr:phage holin family protein [Paenalkalicoccus suaedae]QKS71892.1 phage holin family protein [Paenalkalicoccus suaedae]